MAYMLLAMPVMAQEGQQDGVAKMERLFRQAVDLYTQGRFSEAQRAMRQLMELGPRKELAARLVDEAGTAAMARAYISDDRR